MPLAIRLGLAAAVTVGLALFAATLQSAGDRKLAFSLLIGIAFGVVLQRGRFCFFCNFRDYVEKRDARGLLAILVALAIGAIGYAIVFGAWLPVPTPGRLPPDAHIGPISFVLGVAAFLFGVGMTVSGSCISAHLYRLGEGSPTAPFALLGAALGFGLGYAVWNPLYIAALAGAPAMWLPHHLGYAGSLGITLLAVAALGAAILRSAKPVAAEAPARAALTHSVESAFVQRWPPVVTGLLIGAIATVAYFRSGPLGVTAELGSLARTAASNARILPETLHGLDGFRGCATAVKTGVISPNGVFVIGLVLGSFVAALLANQFKPSRPGVAQAARGLIGGALMGLGAMLALGCTVGVLLSGIHAGAVAGWIFLIACAAGVFVALEAQRVFARG